MGDKDLTIEAIKAEIEAKGWCVVTGTVMVQILEKDDRDKDEEYMADVDAWVEAQDWLRTVVYYLEVDQLMLEGFKVLPGTP